MTGRIFCSCTAVVAARERRAGRDVKGVALCAEATAIGSSRVSGARTGLWVSSEPARANVLACVPGEFGVSVGEFGVSSASPLVTS